jgi:NitT/TauT family transport system ATP-binding protein
MDVQGVSHSYGEWPSTRTIVQDCSFAVEEGKLNVMVGPSGCGKSTVINLLAGYERPDEGSISIDGDPVTEPAWDRLVVFQESALMPWLTTYDNIMFGPRMRGTDNKQMRDRAEGLLNKVGLNDFRKKYPAQLSGGMQRRAEVARAMINEPKVMLLDEPFRGLDAMTRQLIQEYYNQLFEENRRTNLFITSDLDEAIFLADRLLIMSNIPTQVREVVEVDLPRPRSMEHTMVQKEAYDIKEKCLGLLYEEAMKSFASGGAASDFVEAYSKQREE